MRTLSVICLAAALSGCVSISPKEVAAELSRYDGHPFDEFVLANGAPSGNYQMQDGNTLYSWGKGGSAYIPGSATTTIVGKQAYTQYVGGGSISLACELAILVDPSHAIVGIDVRRDTDGPRSNSACFDYVKLPPSNG